MKAGGQRGLYSLKQAVDEGEEGQRGLYSLKQAVDGGEEGQRGLYSLEEAVDEGGGTEGAVPPKKKLWMRARRDRGGSTP